MSHLISSQFGWWHLCKGLWKGSCPRHPSEDPANGLIHTKLLTPAAKSPQAGQTR